LARFSRLGIIPGVIGLAVSLGGCAMFSLLVVIIGTR
jgi:hypothetical protein